LQKSDEITMLLLVHCL